MPHNVMAVDGLTKEMKKSNLKPFLQLMRTGRFRLTAAQAEMDHQSELKEQGVRITPDQGK